jgi:hypothetical protein
LKFLQNEKMLPQAHLMNHNPVKRQNGHNRVV